MLAPAPDAASDTPAAAIATPEDLADAKFENVWWGWRRRRWGYRRWGWRRRYWRRRYWGGWGWRRRWWW